MKRLSIKKLLLVLLGIWLIGISGCGENQVKVLISPRAVTIPLDQQFQFSVEVIDTQDTAVTWSIDNNAVGSKGSVDTKGKYTPPAVIPTSNKISVRVSSKAEPGVSDTAAVTLVSGNELRFGANTRVTDYTVGTATAST